MIITEFLALFLCGVFFGAAVYISIAQHPASMQAGIAVASAFFPPMYHRAAPMQIAAAVGGTAAGAIQWYLSQHIVWLLGAGLLISVIPFTLLVLKPINDQLLNTDVRPSEETAQVLLRQWAIRHWARSAASGLSFALYLWVSLAN